MSSDKAHFPDQANLGKADWGKAGWHPGRLADLTGKVYVITGGNSGIGFQTARLLHLHGADVVLACRNAAHAADAIARLKQANLKQSNLKQPGSGAVHQVHLDLTRPDAIFACVEQISHLFSRVDGLINNAGIMRTPPLTTQEGFELQLATNHLGHFRLTGLMLPLLDPSAGRVVTVSSVAHKRGTIRFDDLMGRTAYNPYRAYCQSKLANLMFALALDRRLRAAGSGVRSIACHPGFAATNVFQSTPGWYAKPLAFVGNSLLAQSAERGAFPSVLAAAGLEAKGGHYYGPTGFMELRGPVGLATIAPQASNLEDSERLWQLSEDLLGIRFSW